MRDLIGRTLGHYRITSKLGEGGMGEVYRAHDERLDRDVAIKVLSEEVAQDADSLARFEREAKLLASLNHPNIATLHGLEEDDGRRFLVMEVVEGGSLATVLTRGAILLDEAMPIALQITRALEVAHEHGIVHRDLKPANVMVDPDGQEVLVQIQPKLAGENLNLTLNAALAGLGIALMPEEAIREEVAKGALKTVLNGYATPKQRFFALYPSSRQL